jgi:K+-transporting ATPase ATPase C chain
MSLHHSQSNESKPVEQAPSRGFAMDMLIHLRVAIVATIVTLVIVSGVYPAIVWGLAQAIFHNKANGSLVTKAGTPTDNVADAVGSAMLGQPFTNVSYFHPRPSAAGNSAGASFSPTGGYDPTSSGGTNYGPLSDELLNGLTLSPTPPATQPVESLQYDGVRLRTIHYAVENHIAFSLFHEAYVKHEDGSVTMKRLEQVPLSQFQNKDGSLNDVALVDAFPHPVLNADAPAYTRIVLVADDFAVPIPADAVTASSSGLDPHITPANAELQKTRVAAARRISPEQVESLIMENTEGPDLGFLGEPGVNVLKLNLALDARYPVPK